MQIESDNSREMAQPTLEYYLYQDHSASLEYELGTFLLSKFPVLTFHHRDIQNLFQSNSNVSGTVGRIAFMLTLTGQLWNQQRTNRNSDFRQ